MTTEQQLLKDVQAELEWDPSVDDSGIILSVSDGSVVTLAGQVGSYADKLAAESAVKSVAGVRAVANEIEVRPGGKNLRSDKEIAETAVAALRANASVPAAKLKVLVDNGWITLEGEVGVRHQQQVAEDTVRHLWGVRGISNRIVFRAQAQPTDVKRKIQQAFQRHAALDANGLHVVVHEGTVTLTGEVDSWHEREAAENAAWAAPGVAHIENQLTIRP